MYFFIVIIFECINVNFEFFAVVEMAEIPLDSNIDFLERKFKYYILFLFFKKSKLLATLAMF